MAGYNVSSKKFGKILMKNGFYYARTTGDHSIYKHRENGGVVSIPKNLNPIIAQRLVKEFKLKVDL